MINTVIILLLLAAEGILYFGLRSYLGSHGDTPVEKIYPGIMRRVVPMALLPFLFLAVLLLLRL